MGIDGFFACCPPSCRKELGQSDKVICETPGMMAFKLAVDELAEKLGIAPIALRLRNDTQIEPMIAAPSRWPPTPDLPLVRYRTLTLARHAGRR